MSGKRVQTLYTCVVCGRAFSSRAALCGHMRVHRDVKWKYLRVRLPAELVDKFYEVVKKHKTTTCSLIHHLVLATVKGDEMGVIDLAAKNPITIQLQSFYAARPKAPGKYAFPLEFKPAGQFEVPRCDLLQSVSVGTGEVYCGGAGTWVSPEKCRKCSFSRGFIKLG